MKYNQLKEHLRFKGFFTKMLFISKFIDRFTPLNLIHFNLITYEEANCNFCDNCLIVQL